MVLRIVILALGAGFLVVGLAGLLRPAQVAEALALTPETPIGSGSIRAVVGAHYMALGLTAVLAAVRRHREWLLPLAAIEGCTALARVVSAVAGELSAEGMAAAGIEVVACIVFGLGAIQPARLKETN